MDMVEIYKVTPALYSSFAIALGLFFFGVYLIMKTTGKRYLGLAGVGVSAVIFFYAIIALLLPAVPALYYAGAVFTLLLCCGIVYFIVLEYAIIRDAFTVSAGPAEYLIVHGAKVLGSVPSPSLQDRLEGTLAYLQKFPHCKAVLTGTKWPWGDMSEAECMYRWLTERGIAAERLILEEHAKNTVDNLRYSMASIHELEGDDSPTIGILTSEYHMHRALFLANRLGISVIGVPVKTADIFVCINYFIREAFAMTELFVFGVKGK